MEPAANDRTLKGLHVLYVEDEPLLRDEVAAFLKRRVQKLHVAANGIEALEIMALYPVDVVVTDLLMPNMDGIQLTEEIRRTKKTVPIFIVTAINDVSVMQSTIALGIDRYLIKPMDIEVLIEALTVVAKQKAVMDSPRESIASRISSETLQKLEAEIAKMIKLSSGKGPDKVSLLLQANLLEIIIKGSRTKLEQTLLSSEDNVRIVDFLRETYYRHLKNDLRQCFSEQANIHGQLQQIQCDSKRDVDQLKWIID